MVKKINKKDLVEITKIKVTNIKKGRKYLYVEIVAEGKVSKELIEE